MCLCLKEAHCHVASFVYVCLPFNLVNQPLNNSLAADASFSLYSKENLSKCKIPRHYSIYYFELLPRTSIRFVYQLKRRRKNNTKHLWIVFQRWIEDQGCSRSISSFGLQKKFNQLSDTRCLLVELQFSQKVIVIIRRKHF